MLKTNWIRKVENKGKKMLEIVRKNQPNLKRKVEMKMKEITKKGKEMNPKQIELVLWWCFAWITKELARKQIGLVLSWCCALIT